MHLDEKYADMVKAILREHIPEYEVWLFGSRAHGRNLKRGSDIDLCVKTGDAPLDRKRKSRLEMAFEDSDLPYFVDVVDWAATAENFRNIIEAEYEVIQTGKNI